MIHALVTLALALLAGPGAGLAAATFFIGREITQAEYRWIEAFGFGKRENMPIWGGLSPKARTLKSVADALLPAAVAAISWVLI